MDLCFDYFDILRPLSSHGSEGTVHASRSVCNWYSLSISTVYVLATIFSTDFFHHSDQNSYLGRDRRFPMAQASRIALYGLPTELHLQIFGWLDYPSCLTLSQTTRFFRARLAVEQPTTAEQKIMFLSAAEKWNRYATSNYLHSYHWPLQI